MPKCNPLARRMPTPREIKAENSYVLGQEDPHTGEGLEAGGAVAVEVDYAGEFGAGALTAYGLEVRTLQYIPINVV